jgi:Icc-related predicted phosphoesterase
MAIIEKSEIEEKIKVLTVKELEIIGFGKVSIFPINKLIKNDEKINKIKMRIVIQKIDRNLFLDIKVILKE